MTAQPTGARRRAGGRGPSFVDVRMGPLELLGHSDGLVRVAIPLEPEPPADWVELFNSSRLGSVAMPGSWNRPVAHRALARLSARPEKLHEYLAFAKQMIEATNAIYRGHTLAPAPLRPRTRVLPALRQPGSRLTARACLDLLEAFDRTPEPAAVAPRRQAARP